MNVGGNYDWLKYCIDYFWCCFNVLWVIQGVIQSHTGHTGHTCMAKMPYNPILPGVYPAVPSPWPTASALHVKPNSNIVQSNFWKSRLYILKIFSGHLWNNNSLALTGISFWFARDGSLNHELNLQIFPSLCLSFTQSLLIWLNKDVLNLVICSL